MKLRPADRRILLWSALVFIATLLALFSLAVVYGDRLNRSFVGPFLWFANIVVALSAGTLAGAMTGFLEVDIERRYGKAGYQSIKAGGGFAVFIVILLVNPKATMTEAANVLFSQYASECERVISDPSAFPDGIARCNRLVELFPGYPAAWMLRGVFLYREAETAQQISVAFDHFDKALALYNERTKAELDMGTEPAARQSLHLELLIRYGSAGADLALSKYREKSTSDSEVRADLAKSKIALFKAESLITADTDLNGVSKIRNFLARILFYEAFLGPSDRREILLTEAVSFLEKAARPSSAGAIFFLPKFEQFYLHAYLWHQAVESAEKSERREKLVAVAAESTSALQSYLASANQRLIRDSSRTTTYVKHLRANTRQEVFLITLPIGSQQFGGDAFKAFLADHSESRRNLKATLGEDPADAVGQ